MTMVIEKLFTLRMAFWNKGLDGTISYIYIFFFICPCPFCDRARQKQYFFAILGFLFIGLPVVCVLLGFIISKMWWKVNILLDFFAVCGLTYILNACKQYYTPAWWDAILSWKFFRWLTLHLHGIYMLLRRCISENRPAVTPEYMLYKFYQYLCLPRQSDTHMSWT